MDHVFNFKIENEIVEACSGSNTIAIEPHFLRAPAYYRKV